MGDSERAITAFTEIIINKDACLQLFAVATFILMAIL